LLIFFGSTDPYIFLSFFKFCKTGGVGVLPHILFVFLFLFIESSVYGFHIEEVAPPPLSDKSIVQKF